MLKVHSIAIDGWWWTLLLVLLLLCRSERQRNTCRDLIHSIKSSGQPLKESARQFETLLLELRSQVCASLVSQSSFHHALHFLIVGWGRGSCPRVYGATFGRTGKYWLLHSPTTVTMHSEPQLRVR